MRIALAFIALGAAACQPNEPSEGGSGTQLRDSAGIRIVENSRPPDGSRLGWRIGPGPAVSIGQREGEDPYLFASATDATTLRDSMPVAERFPVFSSVIADALNHLWIGEYEVPGEEREGVLWTVVDPGGRVLGFVETPERLEIYEIGDDFILGRVRDELDVEYIQVWPLERSDG